MSGFVISMRGFRLKLGILYNNNDNNNSNNNNVENSVVIETYLEVDPKDTSGFTENTTSKITNGIN
jgi:hypothetical protein